MSTGLMAIGMLGAESILGYQADKEQSDAKRAWQTYSNTMTDLSQAMNQNAITQNEILALETSADVAEDIQIDRLRAEGAAQVSAAASGIKGRTIRMGIFDIYRSASIAEGRRTRALDNKFLAFDQQRRSSSMTAALRKNYSFIPKPSLTNTIIGFGSKLEATGIFDPIKPTQTKKK